ncbi:MAG: phospho-sugar mutase [Patescibacteria group bacterium]
MRTTTDLLAICHTRLSPEAYRNLEQWLTDPNYQEFVSEVMSFVEFHRWEEVEDCFYTHLTVGTGGIRGHLGIGPNRINRRIIGEAAQGLVEFMKSFGGSALTGGVVIGYEARKQSLDFAKLCCEIFAANGIKSYLFPHLCATPELSFAVRHFKTTAGVMITASHNPKTDNGFKFYWSDGGQVVPPLDEKFMQCVTAVKGITRIPFEQAQRKSLIQSVSKELDVAYISAVRGLSLSKSRSAMIVFSPLHGAGSTNIVPVLTQEQFKVEVVPQQAEPDEAFPTARGTLINPEYDEVIALAMDSGKQKNADLVLVSDPDADRVGVAVMHQGSLVRLTGNEVGTVLTHYILSQMKRQNRMPPQGLVIKTYVTTSLIEDVGRSFGVEVRGDLLVGFKYIGEIIEKLTDPKNFIFAAEESLGYLAGTFTRDKDAAIASLLLGELASVLKDQKKTIIDYLKMIHEQYGYYKNVLLVREFAGKEGKIKLTAVMKAFRLNPPQELAGQKVLRTIDRYQPQLDASTMDTYKVGKTGDQFTLVLSEDEKTRVTIRPSGTEPTLKCYVQGFVPAGDNLEERSKNLDVLIAKIKDEIDQLITKNSS